MKAFEWLLALHTFSNMNPFTLSYSLNPPFPLPSAVFLPTVSPHGLGVAWGGG